MSRAAMLCLLLGLIFPLAALAQDQPVIKIVVDKESGETISLGIKGAPDVKIEGVKEPFESGRGWHDRKTYTLTGKEIKIVGRVDELDCSENDVTSLEISTQTLNLEYLGCQDNALETIDFSKSPNLRFLVAPGNMFTKLDVSQLKNLESLDLNFNKLTSIDLSANTKLKELRISGNAALSALDLSKNTELAYLVCENISKLTWLDIANNQKLLGLHIAGNKLSPHAMAHLVSQLPTLSEAQREKEGKLVVVDGTNNREYQRLSPITVAEAKAKGWKVLDRNGGAEPKPYEGVEIKFEVKLPEVEHATLSIKGNPNLKAVLFGTELELIVEPATDYKVAEVKVDGVALKAPYKFVVTKEPEIVVVVKHKTSVSDVAATAFTLHPNPAVSYVELSGVEAGATVQLLDLSGRLVLERKLSADARVDVSTLAKGIYLLKVGKHVSKLSIR
ncbi:hypothetical protein HQ48_04740 [Porphyromonas sp. COT-290 OH3588]|nr:hypothetical protein HQ48_04740 [Porphyromonas sp. COT-290 OH3588]